ncbi:MAG: MaoC family dehydratase [Bacteroidia bacterium]|nr:MaoC family dehydratase [Bacteroidia bacterium]
MRFEELKLGMKASITKRITAHDVDAFATLSTDFNPLHMSEEAASKGIFKHRVAHGMLVASLFSAVLGTRLPGEGSIYLGQDLKFIAPVFLDDEITAEVEVVELREDKHIVKLATVAHNQQAANVITGTATILVR